MSDSRPISRQRLLRWLGSLLSLGLLIYLFSSHWQEIISAFQELSLSSLLVALALMLVSRLAVGTRWFMLLRHADSQASWGDVQRLTFAGLFASNFLPTTIGGDVVRLAGAVRFQLDTAVSTASLIVDRLIGMLGMALALPCGLGPVWVWLQAEQFLPAGLNAGSIFLARGWQHSREFLQRIGQALRLWRSRPLSLLAALCFTGIHQLCLYIVMLVLLKNLGQPLPFWQLAGLWSFIYFVTLLPISINGYGVQELALTFFFVQVAGITQPVALAIALLMRTIQMLVSLPGALFMPGILAVERHNG